jgi:molecular chaperone GrpE
VAGEPAGDETPTERFPLEAQWESEGGAVQPEGGGKGVLAPEAVDYRDRWLRAEAELQNYRRRMQRESEQVRRAAEESVLLELIAVVDDLERALRVAEEAGAAESWTRGVALVVQRALDYLQRQGVTAVNPLGGPFDPSLHEAVLEMDATEGSAPGSVLQVVQQGYRRGERSLRAARVVVARRPAGTPSR